MKVLFLKAVTLAGAASFGVPVVWWLVPSGHWLFWAAVALMLLAWLTVAVVCCVAVDRWQVRRMMNALHEERLAVYLGVDP